MEVEQVVIDSEEREEGEIVEDELEDVSDCSIGSPLHFGKSVSSAETLRPVSLSSISDSDYNDPSYDSKHCYKRVCCKRKRNNSYNSRKSRDQYSKSCRRFSKYRQNIHSTTSGSDNEKPDRKTLRQLKEAVRIDTSQEIHYKSLRTRLKGMMEPDNKQDEDDELICLRISALESRIKTDNKEDCVKVTTTTTDSHGDSNEEKELEELRLEALKSAILNKHQVRKKHKAIEEVKNENPNEINKENTQSIINSEIAVQNSKTKTNDNVANKIADKNISIEEDPDIMRAMLLASIAHRITATAPNTNIKNEVIVPNIKLGNQPARTLCTTNISRVFHKFVPNNKRAMQHLTKLTQVKPLIINVNSESDSDTEPVTKSNTETDALNRSVTQLLKQQRAEVEAKLPTVQTNQLKKYNNLINKSAVKLLPKSQQLEYKRLKLKLLNAKKKLLLKNRKTLADRNANVKKTTSKLKVQQNGNNTSTLQPTNKEVAGGVQIQKLLQDIQINKNGRCAVKGKYQALVPLLNKIKKASEERERHESIIKRLLQELQIARNRYTASHETCKNLCQKLIQQKTSIDSMKLNRILTNKEGNKVNQIHTSTPVKPVKEEPDKCNLSEIGNDNNDKVIKELSQNTKALQIIDGETTTTITEKQQEEIVLSKPCVSEYISPLNPKASDGASVDPLATICPYDLMGDCRDAECKFKHCS